MQFVFRVCLRTSDHESRDVTPPKVTQPRSGLEAAKCEDEVQEKKKILEFVSFFGLEVFGDELTASF